MSTHDYDYDQAIQALNWPGIRMLRLDDVYRVQKLDNSITFMKVTDEITPTHAFAFTVSECTQEGELIPEGLRRDVTSWEINKLKPYWQLLPTTRPWAVIDDDERDRQEVSDSLIIPYRQ